MKTTRILVFFALTSWGNPALAGAKEQAYRLHSRLAGVPPSPEVLSQMETLLASGNAMGAAALATDHASFYNVTLKNWATPWTNEDMSGRATFNDYVATIVGMTRDNVPFDQALYGDILYTASGTQGIPAYSPANNDHYAALETGLVDLKTALVKGQQSTLNPAVKDVAGVLTSRAFGQAYFDAGTNRAAIRFSFMTFLCNDMEQMSDTTIPDFRVRRDVERQPGGDSKVYRNKCAGCHAGMDGFGGAFANFDWDGTQVLHTPAVVRPKYAQNAKNFPDGWVTADNGWVNLWTNGQNARIGWNGAASGNGAQEYGKMLAATDAFPICMAKRVYSAVCLQDIQTIENSAVMGLADQFKADAYNLKNLFAASALRCMGE